jgi:amino acid adenylation domain-containing protein
LPTEPSVAQDSINGFRLSPQQRRLWSLVHGDRAPAYRSQCVVVIDGELTIAALSHAVREVVEAHEILHTTFQSLPGMAFPVQVIGNADAFAWRTVDFSDVSRARQDIALDAMFEAQRCEAFDPHAGPLVRAVGITLGPRRHALLIACSPLCADAASLPVLVDAIVRRCGRGAIDELETIEPPQYADFAEWENGRIESLESATPFGASQALAAPEYAGADAGPFAPLRSARRLPADLACRLEQLADSWGTSASTVWLACWRLLLWRLGHSSTVWFRDEGRDQETSRAVGLFERYLPTPSDLEDDLPLRDLVHRIARQVQDAPASLDPGTADRKSPLTLQFGFDQAAPDITAAGHGLDVSMRKLYACSHRCALRLSRVDASGFELHYDPLQHAAGEIERLAERYVLLLERIARNPDGCLASFDVTVPAERRQLLSQSNRTQFPDEGRPTVAGMVAEQARRTPGALAVWCDGRELTYAELTGRADRWARALRARGVGPEVLVALCVERSVDAIVALLAIWKAGGAYVPLDPAYPRQRLSFILSDAQPALLLTVSTLVDRLPAGEIPVMCLDLLMAADAGPDGPTEAALRDEGPADRLAYVMYTSGTTGEPKGVMITHANLRHYVHALQSSLRINADDRYLHTASLAFSSSIRQALLPLCCGAALVVATRDEVRAPLALFELIKRLEVTVLDIVPTYWRTCVQILGGLDGAARATILANKLRLLLSASEPLASDLPQLWTLGFAQPTALVNMYGQTETAGIVAVHPIQAQEGDTPAGVPIGRPIANTPLYVLNSQLQPAPVGVAGEIHVGGAGVGRGYRNRPALNAQKFIPDPFSDAPEAGFLYKTGDLGRYLPDGTIELVGRIDAQIKIRGFRVDPKEIEGALRQDDAVLDAVAVCQQTAGHDPRLVAFVVHRAGRHASAGTLLRDLRAKLPEHAVPEAMVFLDKIPLTDNGKVDRRALESSAGNDGDARDAREVTAPANPTQELLAQIWAGVLGTGDLSIHDNFFEVGGQSLLAAQMLARVRGLFQVDISWRRLFEAPTIAGLAHDIDSRLSPSSSAGAAPLVAVSRNQHLRPSIGQHRLWFLDQLVPGTSSYNLLRALRFRGPLDISALERSLNEIIRRHEILRAIFPAEDGEPILVLMPSLTLHLAAVATTEAALEQAIEQEGDVPFNLSRGPLIRVKLFILADDDHVLALTMHHIVSDGWSMGIFFRELGALYDAFCEGRPSPLSPLQFQYADFAEWQRQSVESAAQRVHLDFWKAQLAGSVPVVEVPTDRPRDPGHRFQSARDTLALTESASSALRTFSGSEGVTLFMTLLAAFQVLLHRYTWDNDIVVAAPVAGRTRNEVEGLIGFFVNTPLYRASLADDPTFRELVARLREVVLEVHAHQDIPFETLASELGWSRDIKSPAMFNTLFNFLSFGDQRPAMQALQVAHVRTRHHAAKVDLALVVTDEGTRLTADLWSDTRLFDRTTSVRMLGHFRTVLDGVIANPDRRVSSLPLLGADERQLVLRDWNETATDLGAACCLHQLVEAQAERTPDAVAVFAEGERLTYAQLNGRANQLARYLRARGVGPDVIVGIAVERSPAMIVGLLAVLKAGGAYLPLDPTYPAERLAFMLQDAAVSVLLKQARHAIGAPAPTLVVCIDTDWDSIAAERDSSPDSGVAPRNLAYVMYTSGSTGAPKGTLIEHRSAVNFIRFAGAEYGLTRDDKMLQFASINFDASVEEIFAPLACGSTLVLRSDAMLASASVFVQQCAAWKVTVVGLPTAYWHELTLALGMSGAGALPPSVRCVIVGGESVRADRLEMWRQCVGARVRLINTYGPTEATVVATCCELGAEAGADSGPGEVPIGRPIWNTQIFLLDEHQQPVPIGVKGEIYIGGACLARGYQNRRDLTSERFIRNPFDAAPGARLYRTGDVARYRADGSILIAGRTDQQIKVRGFRIEPGEIETTLRTHPSIEDAIVVGRPTESGQTRLVAYVSGDAVQAPAELREHLKKSLPEYMIPAAFHVVASLPRLTNGKIDRSALPEPEETPAAGSPTWTAPRTAIEQQLAGIWSQVLGVPRVGIHDNFFDLGGHSLLSIQLIARIEKRFGKTLPVAVLFESPTVEQLAALLANEGRIVAWSPLIAVQPAGSKLPFFWIHGDWSNATLPEYLGPDRPLYALEHQALDGRPACYTRVETIAGYYLQELKTICPHGPYVLGGYSFGAAVAFELAHQLTSAREEVAALFLLDPPGQALTPPSPAGNGSPRSRRPLARRTTGQSLLRRTKSAVADLFGVPRIWIGKTLQRLRWKAYLRYRRILPPSLRSAYILDVYRQALQSYTPSRYGGPVTIVATNSPRHRPPFAWVDFITGPVEIHQMAGGHMDLTREPQVAQWAATLQASLERVTVPARSRRSRHGDDLATP